jgi:undecaprenyl-diphosphatase
LPGCACIRRTRASASSPLAGAVEAADAALLSAAAQLRHPSRDQAIAAFSTLGNSGVGWVALGGLVALARRDARPAVAVAVAVWGTLAVNYGIKQVARRERPQHEDAPQLIDAPTSSSFPSSHAAMSAAGSLVLGQAVPAARVPLKLAAVAMTYSRVHLGVHHPSDVVAG